MGEAGVKDFIKGHTHVQSHCASWPLTFTFIYRRITITLAVTEWTRLHISSVQAQHASRHSLTLHLLHQFPFF